jgi:hypothetical protein
VGLLRDPLHDIDFSGELPPPPVIVQEEPLQPVVVFEPLPKIEPITVASTPIEPVMVEPKPNTKVPDPVKPIPPPPQPQVRPLNHHGIGPAPLIPTTQIPPKSASSDATVTSANGYKVNGAGVRIISIRIGDTF